MTESDYPQPAADVQGEIESTQSPLATYVRELKRFLELQREKSEELAATNRQLVAEAKILKATTEAQSRRSQELEDAYFDTVVRLTKASEYRDPESGAHVVRMSHYAEALALHLGLGPEYAGLIHAAAAMHDVGKIGIPDMVLLKEGPLSPDEWEMMRKHPVIGAQLLEGSKSPLLEMARQIALTHHERWDGSGYPAGLLGEAIPMAGRIVMLADCYDNLRMDRSYKPRVNHGEAVDVLLAGDDKSQPAHFDSKVLAGFGEIQGQFASVFDLFQD
jgi:putative two-component system response regulator